MKKQAISTPNAPSAIGTYSQAIRTGDLVFVSGQIGLDPKTMLLAEGTQAQIDQVFANLRAIAQEAGGTVNDFVKLNVYLVDLNDFGKVNEAMTAMFDEPFPARAAVGISELPKGARVEVEGILAL